MMALQIDSSFDIYTYPPLTDADYMITSRNASRRMSRKGSRSPMALSPTLAFADSGEQKDDRPVLDPRRFTPTLHANLVSEILALRREVENKNDLVVSLEEHMVKVKDENANLHEIVSSNSKEQRILKRQLKDLENSTLVAVEEIAKERDHFSESLADTKVKLELSQKKARTQEVEKEEIQVVWRQDQDKWNTERKTLELKVHVVESRLKTVLAEVATQSVAQHGKYVDNSYQWSRDQASSRASGRRSPASQHRDSFSNDTSEGSKTLADELNSQAVSDTESEGCLSPGALPEEADLFPRSSTSQSNRQSIKARKLLGLHIDTAEERSVPRDSLLNGYASILANDDSYQSAAFYSDSATQFSPPPSPELTAEQRLSTITEFDEDSVLDHARARPSSRVMTSSACQTLGIPLSPPDTPPIQTHRIEFITASTQTSEILSTAETYSHDSSSSGDVTPTRSNHSEMVGISKNASAQVDLTNETISVGIQTESIRTDERLTKLPVYLHPAVIHPISPAPSTVTSLTSSLSAMPKTETETMSKVTTPPSMISPQLRSQSPEKKGPISRSSLYQPQEESGLLCTDDELSDDSFLNRKPVKKSLSKVQDSWQVVSLPIDDRKSIIDSDESIPKLPTLEFEDFSLDQKSSKADLRQRRFKQVSDEQNIDSGKGKQPLKVAKANTSRGRSPSEPLRITLGGQIATNPISGLPYPVPDRSSSRKFLWLADDFENASRASSAHSRASQSVTRRPIVRKSRSYVSSQDPKSRRSLSPEAFDVFTNSLNNIPPPLPRNNITSPTTTRFGNDSYPATPTQAFPSSAESTRSEQATVVDSIAQTMIGEWMYKYVRRRKSFGIPDEPGTGENSVNGGTRHQRWVWIAPYERAVLWSSKQPTSENALMGKNGRKLVISSVLDVQDDSPMPRGAPETSYFGRSILILTPQRALKFTATSIHRHHVWMNALSFLAQDSTNSVEPEQRPQVQAMAKEEEPRAKHQMANASLHRSQITNSIRIAKGRKRFSPQGSSVSSPLTESLPNQEALHIKISEGAEAPVVPRCSADIRNRLNNTSHNQPYSTRSYASGTGPILRYLHNNRGVSSNADAPRSILRFWSGKTQRGLIDENSSKRISRALTSYSMSAEQENLFEAIGTMRMSAFVQDTSERYISNQRKSKSRSSLLDSKSISTSTLDLQSIRKGSIAERPTARRRQSRRRMAENSINNDSVPELPNFSRNSVNDPFEGF